MPGRKSGSIYDYCCVAKEKHKDSPVEASRSLHHHGMTATAQRHYWNKVVKVSRRKGVQMHAVEHENYYTMFNYVRSPSAGKPVHELDPKLYLSPDHPQGDALKELLQKGEANARALQGRRRQPAGKQKPTEQHGAVQPKRQTLFATAFAHVVDNGLRGKAGAKQFQADAVKAYEAGHPRLLEFARKHRADLRDQMSFIWELKGAAGEVKRMEESRCEVLLRAAQADGDECKNTAEAGRCGQALSRRVLVNAQVFFTPGSCGRRPAAWFRQPWRKLRQGCRRNPGASQKLSVAAGKRPAAWVPTLAPTPGPAGR